MITQTYATAAGTDKTYYIDIPYVAEWEIIGASFTPDGDGAVSTHGTDYISLAVKQGSTTIASLTTNSSGGAALVAGTPTVMTLSNAPSTEFTGKTDVISLVGTNAGGGKVLKGVVSLMVKMKQAKAYPSA
jgi:hypothetical protein